MQIGAPRDDLFPNDGACVSYNHSQARVFRDYRADAQPWRALCVSLGGPDGFT